MCLSPVSAMTSEVATAGGICFLLRVGIMEGQSSWLSKCLNTADFWTRVAGTRVACLIFFFFSPKIKQFNAVTIHRKLKCSRGDLVQLFVRSGKAANGACICICTCICKMLFKAFSEGSIHFDWLSLYWVPNTCNWMYITDKVESKLLVRPCL